MGGWERKTRRYIATPSLPSRGNQRKVQMAFGPLVRHSRVIEQFFFFLCQLAKCDFLLFTKVYEKRRKKSTVS